MKNKFLFIILSLFLVLAGCSTQNYDLTKGDDFLLTNKEVINTLTDNGLELSEKKDIEIELFKLYYTNPVILTMENNELLLVYTFNDFKSREVAEEEVFIRRQEFVGLFDDDILTIKTSVAKNALLIHTVSEENKYGSDVYDKLSLIVFEKLNEGEERLYIGSGEYWEGELLVKSYFHWWEDENGKFIDSDSNRTETGKFHYKGNVDDVVTSIEYKIDDDFGSSGGKGQSLDKDGYLNLGTSGGSNSHVNPLYRVTINWNDKVETFELKPTE